VIRIPRLEGAYQDVEGGELAQIFEARVREKKRPAGETVADASLQPFECGFAASDDGEDAIPREPRRIWLPWATRLSLRCQNGNGVTIAGRHRLDTEK